MDELLTDRSLSCNNDMWDAYTKILDCHHGPTSWKLNKGIKLTLKTIHRESSCCYYHNYIYWKMLFKGKSCDHILSM